MGFPPFKRLIIRITRQYIKDLFQKENGMDNKHLI